MIIEVPDLTGAECGEIAITAAEGGIGYWSQIETYDWHRWAGPKDYIGFGHVDNSKAPDNPDFVFYTIEFENPESDDPPTLRADITPALIGNGLIRALRARVPVVMGLLPAAREDWTGEIDANIADIIVQYGVFGELVFG